MRLGILGGSFNPVHFGHLFIADKALTALKIDRVVMIPANISPFKIELGENVDSVRSSNGSDRLEMLAAAVIGDCRIAIDDCEIRREGVSYTVDTLEDIIARYCPSGKPYLIIGDDLAQDFPKWKDSDKILELADIVIVRRITTTAVKYPFPNIFIDNEVMNISSQTVRQKIREGSDWRSLVPSGARAIIEDKRLYALKEPPMTSEDCSMEMILRIEAAARENLTLERFLHSRNTALLSHDLCLRFGLDPMAGYLAGIAHDLCKQLDPKQMLKLVKMDGGKISSLERDKPGLLHGRAAAILLMERFCINNRDILEAVAFHTSGNIYMRPLAKVVYVADKMEVSRNIEPALREALLEADLDTLLLAAVNKNILKLQAKKVETSEETIKLLEKLKEKNS